MENLSKVLKIMGHSGLTEKTLGAGAMINVRPPAQMYLRLRFFAVS